MLTAVALKLWAIKGEKRLQQLLAEMEYVFLDKILQFYIILGFVNRVLF